jgi:hypothetical protein
MGAEVVFQICTSPIQRVAYPHVADNVSRPLPFRLRRVKPPVGPAGACPRWSIMSASVCMGSPSGGYNARRVKPLRSVTQRFLCIPIPRISACKTGGEGRGPCGPRVAITRHGQSKAWHAGAGIGTSLDMGERVVLVRSSILLPPPRGQTDWQNVPPMPWQDAFP